MLLLYVMVSRLLVCLRFQRHMYMTGVEQREQAAKVFTVRSTHKHPKHSTGGWCLWPVHLIK